MKIKIILIIMFVLSLFLNQPIEAEIKTIPLSIGTEKFIVEIADTVEKQIRGFMFRRAVPDNSGMLFTYNREEYHSFWMKNTLVHLDIIYLNKDKIVVDLFINVPPCKSDPCPGYKTRIPAQYVLELRGNRAKELDLKIGDEIAFLLD